MNIETVLRHIDPNEVRRSGVAFHDPSLRMQARLAAQATVRVLYGTGGRGTCFFSGSLTLGGCGLPSTDNLHSRQWQDTSGDSEALSRIRGTIRLMESRNPRLAQPQVAFTLIVEQDFVQSSARLSPRETRAAIHRRASECV